MLTPEFIVLNDGQLHSYSVYIMLFCDACQTQSQILYRTRISPNSGTLALQIDLNT